MCSAFRHLIRCALIALAVVPMASCDPRLVHETDMNPREIQNLSGVWQGQAALSFLALGGGKRVDSPCPAVYLWTMKVNAGNVEGEVVNKDTPNAPKTRFTTFLDFDASIHVFMRPDGRDSNVLGAFLRHGFSGTSKSADCSYTVRLDRVSGS